MTEFVNRARILPAASWMRTYLASVLAKDFRTAFMRV